MHNSRTLALTTNIASTAPVRIRRLCWIYMVDWCGAVIEIDLDSFAEVNALILVLASTTTIPRLSRC